MDVCDEDGEVKLSERWGEALRVQGLEVLEVVPTLTDRRDIIEILERADGIFLPGGNTNIHPKRYGQTPIDPKIVFGEGCVPKFQFSDARDHASKIMVDYALENDVPLLAVCRGMQELNVAFGGSMQQRIYRHDHGYQKGNDWKELAHNIDVVEGTRLCAAFGRAGLIAETSIHRQGMYQEDIAEQLMISAMADDGLVVEGIEHKTHPWMVGIQFHGELSEKQPINAQIFKSFRGAIEASLGMFLDAVPEPVKDVLENVAA